MEVREDFLVAGGKDYHYIPCMNDQTDWIEALQTIALEHMAFWPRVLNSQSELELRAQRAMALGAKNNL